VKKDAVATSEPKAGSVVTPGSVVTIQLSTGPEGGKPGQTQPGTVPDVTKQRLVIALGLLKSAGYANVSDQVTPFATPQGYCYVIGQNPAAGTAAPPETPIALQVIGDPNKCKRG
jgi:beta-lactam-binding protein with PASTA domain